MGTKNIKVAVIGAGPAGLTAAYELTKQGIAVDLYEAAPFVGGMARSIELWGQTVDIGPHRFFSTDTRVNKLWLELIGDDYVMVERLTRIYFGNKFYHYPIKAFDALKNLGLVEASLCVASYLHQKIRIAKSDPNDSFESWVTARFGKRLYRHFFKSYSEKLWGIPCTELDADFAAQRIKKLSLFEAVKSALLGSGGERHKTLVERFAYANHGTGQLYEAMKRSIEAKGGKIYLETPVEHLLAKSNKIIGLKLTDGQEIKYDQIISSMPLTLLVSRLKNVPINVQRATKELTFRNTVIVYLKVSKADIFPDNWIYVHNKNLKTGRITNFSNWSPGIKRGQKDTILAMEYWCFDQDDFWHWTDDKYIELAKQEIIKTGLVKEGDIVAGKVLRVPKCYPVYSKNYKRPLAVIEKYVRQYDNLQVIGRYGAFKYNNQDHSILMGLLAAKNICGTDQYDLWSINTDYDNYQEKSIISEAGLVIK